MSMNHREFNQKLYAFLTEHPTEKKDTSKQRKNRNAKSYEKVKRPKGKKPKAKYKRSPFINHQLNACKDDPDLCQKKVDSVC